VLQIIPIGPGNRWGRSRFVLGQFLQSARAPEVDEDAARGRLCKPERAREATREGVLAFRSERLVAMARIVRETRKKQQYRSIDASS
jgi:hypothetical protein